MFIDGPSCGGGRAFAGCRCTRTMLEHDELSVKHGCSARGRPTGKEVESASGWGIIITIDRERRKTSLVQRRDLRPPPGGDRTPPVAYSLMSSPPFHFLLRRPFDKSARLPSSVGSRLWPHRMYFGDDVQGPAGDENKLLPGTTALRAAGIGYLLFVMLISSMTKDGQR